MDYINNFIFILIYLNILVSSLIISRILIGKIAALVRFTNIKQYQVTNWYVTIFCIYFYIFGPLIGLYLLRVYNINRSLDLKILYEIMQNNFILEILISKIFIIILGISIIINVVLSIILIHKKITNQIFNLYFFIRYNIKDRNIIFDYIFKYLHRYYDTDIISFYFLYFSDYLNKRWAYYKLNLKWEKDLDIFYSKEYTKKRDLYLEYNKNRPWYHLHVIFIKIIDNKYYNKILIPFSPVIVILYDCIKNDWVITLVYYYLLIYVPLMLFRRFTILLSKENDTIGGLIWDILYKKEHCIYALPKDHRKLFDVYIANGIRIVDLGPPALMDLDVSWYINRSAHFTFNEQANLYYNGVDISLKLLPGNRLVYEYTDYDTQKEVEEEWFLIAVKYAYHDDNGTFALIVSINENNT